jgi:hypothetical protein
MEKYRALISLTINESRWLASVLWSRPGFTWYVDVRKLPGFDLRRSVVFTSGRSNFEPSAAKGSPLSIPIVLDLTRTL